MSLLFIYDYFYPAYKAGGPIQSLVNAAALLANDYDIFVYTSCYDLNSTTPISGIEVDTWTEVHLPNTGAIIQVWYNYKAGYKAATKNMSFQHIYLNGIFTPSFFLVPLFHERSKQSKLIVSPRGMLQRGAIEKKYYKKIAYINFLKLSGYLKLVKWHATDSVEAEDIKHQFPFVNTIEVVPNIPKKPISDCVLPNKVNGKLSLVYLSLIADKKNLHLAIKAISATTANVSLDIYGPIKDEMYWKECQLLIQQSTKSITYKGDVLPTNVQITLSKYDAGIFLTKGENFGHALYECFSVGRPIITSHFTPWNNLENKFAGWNVDINLLDNITKAIDNIATMPNNTFFQYCNGAYQLAKEHYAQLDALKKYKQLFS
jgi:glycosyltransferase involved in cell wall biosynthesis